MAASPQRFILSCSLDDPLPIHQSNYQHVTRDMFHAWFLERAKTNAVLYRDLGQKVNGKTVTLRRFPKGWEVTLHVSVWFHHALSIH